MVKEIEAIITEEKQHKKIFEIILKSLKKS